jgi:hypothetical protein
VEVEAVLLLLLAVEEVAVELVDGEHLLVLLLVLTLQVQVL